MTEFDDPGVTDDERTSGHELTEREIDALSQAANRSIEWFHTLSEAKRHEAVRTIVDEFQVRYRESASVGVDEEDAEAIEDPDPRWEEFSSSAVEDVTPDWPTRKDSEDE
jgi:hypothetical protein